jgi:egghead protein (zeste-white 4 protein)
MSSRAYENGTWDLRARVPRGPGTWSSRLKNLLTFSLVFGGVFWLQDLFWSHSSVPAWFGGDLWAWLGLVWCLPLPIALFMLGGFLSYRRPETPVSVIPQLVSWRFVSRGENTEVLRAAIKSVHDAMHKVPLFEYVIEVISDMKLDNLSGLDVERYVVPAGYRTPNGSLYKARALHYAVTHSTLPDEAWVMCCDEESHATPSLVSGIAQAVLEEERSGEHRIGQGVLLYHNGRKDHPFLTMADMMRSGDDVGRFSLQTRLFGVAIFGFHGSFILVRNSVAKEVGYDFGPKGSITEDAFWALAQMERGRRCRFVDGYMIEQSPQTVGDFMKQRRRWFLGLYETVRGAPARLRFRLPLAICVSIWSLSWLTVFYTAMNLLIGYKTPLPIRIGGNLVFASFLSTYLIGMRLNLEDSNPGFLRSFAWMVGQLVTIPLYSVWESLGVVYGFLKPELGFHVIAKSPHGGRPRSAVRPAPRAQPGLVTATAHEAWAARVSGMLREDLTRLEGALMTGLEQGESTMQRAGASRDLRAQLQGD